MIVEGRESLPMVGRVDISVVPSGPYIILLPFQSLSMSHASLALRVLTSAVDCISEGGRVDDEVLRSLRVDGADDKWVLCVYDEET